MLNKKVQHEKTNAFTTDALDWLSGKRHGHMGKWQYEEPKRFGDTVRGNILWDRWEMVASKDNMLFRQSQIIAEQAKDMAALMPECKTLVDLGPGGKHAVVNNTLPFIKAFGNTLEKFIAIDMTEEAAKGACKTVQEYNPALQCYSMNEDFYSLLLNVPYEHPVMALMMGGTIGNFEAEQNTKDTLSCMAARIKKLKTNLPEGSILLVGLEATQDPKCLYGDYDHPAHAEFEINIMHTIKRDVIPDVSGYNPYAWKYAMKWWPDAYQFCHIAEATQEQHFNIMGNDITFTVGTQLVVDNSFKLPVIAMQRATQLSGCEFIRTFSDNEARMVIHAIRL